MIYVVIWHQPNLCMSQKISKHLQKNEVSHSTSIARVVSTMKFYALSLFVTLCFGAAQGCEGDWVLLAPGGDLIVCFAANFHDWIMLHS